MKPILASIALRNLSRHGRRTLITALVLTVGIGMFIFFDSILAGMDRMTIDSMEAYGDATVTLMTAEYARESRTMPIGPEFGLKGVRDILASLPSLLPDMTAATPRTPFMGWVSNRIDSLPAAVVAVDPESDAKVFGVARKVASGSWFGASAADVPGDVNRAVLGTTLARDLGLETGDWFVLQARTADDSLNADEFIVSGIVDVPSQDINRTGIFIDFSAARALLGDDMPVAAIAVSLARTRNLDAQLAGSERAAQAIEAAFSGIDAKPLAESATDYLAMRNMKAKYSSLIILIVLLIAGVGIVNTILMSVYSRVKEIGVLRAYGMTARQIRRLFSLEGLFLGMLGSLGGVALGCLCVWASARWGIRIDRMLAGLDLGVIPIGDALRGEWHPQVIFQGFAFGVLASWLSATIPASRAGRLEVTEALRFV